MHAWSQFLSLKAFLLVPKCFTFILEGCQVVGLCMCVPPFFSTTLTCTLRYISLHESLWGLCIGDCRAVWVPGQDLATPLWLMFALTRKVLQH